jgi:hypothetical protein
VAVQRAAWEEPGKREGEAPCGNVDTPRLTEEQETTVGYVALTGLALSLTLGGRDYSSNRAQGGRGQAQYRRTRTSALRGARAGEPRGLGSGQPASDQPLKIFENRLGSIDGNGADDRRAAASGRVRDDSHDLPLHVH